MVLLHPGVRNTSMAARSKANVDLDCFNYLYSLAREVENNSVCDFSAQMSIAQMHKRGWT
jgi:hypothetical protein